MTGLDWSIPEPIPDDIPEVPLETPPEPISALETSGYGDDHVWENLGVMPRRQGMYCKFKGWRCLKCPAYFRHFFTLPSHDNIHDVIKRAGIPRICPRKK